MERVVIAFGGSILAPEHPDPAALNQYAQAVQQWSQHVQPLIVVGGGFPARQAIGLARSGGSTLEEDMDRIGIAATRMNANVFQAFLKANGVDTNHRVPRRTEVLVEEADDHVVVVMGGTLPGHSTDQVAVELAQRAGASRIIIASNVDAVYSADPNVDPDAKRIPSLSFSELLDIVGGPNWTEAGAKGIVDGPAAAELVRCQIETRVVGGRNLQNLTDAVLGRDFDGTVVG